MSRPQNSCRTLLRATNQSIWAPKRQNQSQNWVKFKSQNSGNHRKWKLFNYMSRPQNSFRTNQPTPKKFPLEPQKVKNDPKIKLKSICQYWRKHWKWKLFNYMSTPQNSCRSLLRPQTSLLGPKNKINHKIKWNSNVRIQGIIENESCSTIWLNPKTVVKL